MKKKREREREERREKKRNKRTGEGGEKKRRKKKGIFERAAGTSSPFVRMANSSHSIVERREEGRGRGRNFLADNDFPLELCAFSIEIFRGNECGFGTEWIHRAGEIVRLKFYLGWVQSVKPMSNAPTFVVRVCAGDVDKSADVRQHALTHGTHTASIFKLGKIVRGN